MRYLIWFITIFILLIIGAICRLSIGEAKWNNGYCECGGHWEYVEAVGHRNHTGFIYECSECGKHIEITNLDT